MTTTLTLLYRILKNPNHNILLDNGIRVHSPGDRNDETGTPLLRTEYSYNKGGYGADSTTAQVQSIEQADRRCKYWYDKRGNITRESWQGMATAAGTIAFEGNTISSVEGDALALDAATLESRYQKIYTYDALSQLLRADDERAGTTWTYAYDLGGNMVEKRSMRTLRKPT